MASRNEIRRLADRQSTHAGRRRKRSRLRWLYSALTAGAAFAAAHFFGAGTLRADAAILAGLVFMAVLFAPHLRLRRPPAAQSGNRVTLRSSERKALLWLFGLSSLVGAAHVVVEATSGYADLKPVALMGAEPAAPGFYAVSGVVDPNSLYRMSGSEGDRWAASLDRYDGRLLVLFDAKPPLGAGVKVTGRLRDKLLAVQQSGDGAPEGPFASQYRAAMGLPDGTRIYFLDTAMRAGLNALAISAFAVPLYLFFLTLGVPEPRPTPLFTRRPYADPRRRRATPDGRRPTPKPRS